MLTCSCLLIVRHKDILLFADLDTVIKELFRNLLSGIGFDIELNSSLGIDDKMLMISDSFVY